MKFEIMGQKEKWLIFGKDGNGVEYKGNILYEENINYISKYECMKILECLMNMKFLRYS